MIWNIGYITSMMVVFGATIVLIPMFDTTPKHGSRLNHISELLLAASLSCQMANAAYKMMMKKLHSSMTIMFITLVLSTCGMMVAVCLNLYAIIIHQHGDDTVTDTIANILESSSFVNQFIFQLITARLRVYGNTGTHFNGRGYVVWISFLLATHEIPFIIIEQYIDSPFIEAIQSVWHRCLILMLTVGFKQYFTTMGKLLKAQYQINPHPYQYQHQHQHQHQHQQPRTGSKGQCSTSVQPDPLLLNPRQSVESQHSKPYHTTIEMEIPLQSQHQHHMQIIEIEQEHSSSSVPPLTETCTPSSMKKPIPRLGPHKPDHR